MESNGKRVDRQGRELQYAERPRAVGREGTVSQHSFTSCCTRGPRWCGGFHRRFSDAALSPMQSEAQALAFGRPSPGCRRISNIRQPAVEHAAAGELDARNLGRLIALYEHKVFTQA